MPAIETLFSFGLRELYYPSVSWSSDGSNIWTKINGKTGLSIGLQGPWLRSKMYHNVVNAYINRIWQLSFFPMFFSFLNKAIFLINISELSELEMLRFIPYHVFITSILDAWNYYKLVFAWYCKTQIKWSLRYFLQRKEEEELDVIIEAFVLSKLIIKRRITI